LAPTAAGPASRAFYISGHYDRFGAGTVAAAPLFTLRRLRRTDVPSTLRVAE